MQIILYLAESPSGKRYVGITKSALARRWSEHQSASRRGSAYIFHSALRKYGASAFKLSALGSYSTWTEACAAERALILSMGTRAPHGYNVTIGGEGAVGVIFTDERRRQMSLRHKGKIVSAESRAKMSASKRITHRTEAVRARISAARRGHAMPIATRLKIAASMKLRGPRGKLTRAAADRIREQILFGARRKDVSRQHEISLPNVCLIVARKIWNQSTEHRA